MSQGKANNYFEHMDKIEGGWLYSWSWYGLNGSVTSKATFIPEEQS